MVKLPKLNFPSYSFKTTKRGLDLYVWDAQRGSWLLLTPEEWVRQHTICYLREQLGALDGCIAQEYVVCLGESAQRADIVVFGRSTEPLMVVECKAAEISINSDVLSQAVRYNSVIGAPYLFLTNGMRHYFYALREGVYVALDAAPSLTGE